MSGGILRVHGERVVDSNGNSIILRGAGLGGWMNMENFITGYPGHESQHRAAMLKVLGQENYEFFFDKFLEYFFLEEDAKFFASLGLNCIRVPFNYRHFEDDMNPRVLKESGFKHLDRVINLVCNVPSRFHVNATNTDSVVCEAFNLHYPRYAHRTRRPESRLALRQPYELCSILGLQRPPRPNHMAMGKNCRSLQRESVGCRIQSYQ